MAQSAEQAYTHNVHRDGKLKKKDKKGYIDKCSIITMQKMHTHKYMLAPWCVLCCQLSAYDGTMVCAMLSAVCIRWHHGACYAVSCLHTMAPWCVLCCHLSTYNCTMVHTVSCLHTTAPWCVLCCQLSTYNCAMVYAMLSQCQLSTYDCTTVRAMLSAVDI